MPNLADSHMREQFVRRLETCETSRNRDLLDQWEVTFVEGLRKRFDSREDAIDMGITPWSPSVKQWNQLGELERKLS